MSPCRVARALVVAAVMTGGAVPAAAQNRHAAEVLRDLPSGGNLFAILETAQPEITTDRFNSGGLNGGEAERASAFLASWRQTLYRVGDVSISSPVDGTPMLFPALAWWSGVEIATGVMPEGATATGLALSLEPRRAADRWNGAVEVIASGGGLAQQSPSSRPPAIAQLERWRAAHAIAGGESMNGRLGLVIGGAWTDASVLARGRAATRTDHQAAFTHATFAIDPHREVRALAWLTDSARHVQGTFDRTGRWRVFGGYTSRSTDDPPPPAGIAVDRLVDGPVPLAIDSGGQEKRVVAGTRGLKTIRRHAVAFGAEVERTSFAAAPAFAGVIEERVDGLPARIWRYRDPGLRSHRRAIMVTAFAQDRITLSPRASLDVSVRFESADGEARGAERGIRWRTWLPGAYLHWDLATPLKLRLLTGASRSADQLTLDLLAHGDPAAAVADVYRWDGGPLAGAPLVSRAGPGTGGDPAFSAIEPRLKRPVTDQFALGLEASPTTTLRLSVVGLARRQASVIHAINMGVPVDGYRRFTIPDANADLVGPSDDQELPVYDRLPASFGADRYLLTNPELEAATMGAVVVSASLSAPRLTLRVGGTASASVGSGGNRGYTVFENDQSISGELFTNPNAQTYARGRLFNDRAYTIKLLTVYQLPADLRLGAIVRYQDGQPFSRMVVVPSLNQGAEAIQAFANGRSRFSYRSTVDVRLQKGITAGRTRLDLILDAYNLLNMATEVEEYVVTGPRFRETTAVQPPRSFHVGARVSF